MSWKERAKQAVEKKEGVSTPTKPTKPHFVSSVSSGKGPFRQEASDYTTTDLAEIDRLLRELAKLENWSREELADMLDQRKRMAPVNVLPVLKEIREAHSAALGVWPDKPATRSNIRLCKLDHVEMVVIEGSKHESSAPTSSKTPVRESEAA